MNRAELEKYIAEEYGVSADYPWEGEPEYAVYRHAANRKWFALFMRVPSERLSLPGGGDVDIVNLKCDPVTIGAVMGESGIFPAYHMNKENWLSVALDGSADEDLTRTLVDMSYDLTMPKPKRRKNGAEPK